MSRTERRWEWRYRSGRVATDGELDRMLEAVESVIPKRAWGFGFSNGTTGLTGYMFYANKTKARKYGQKLASTLGVVAETVEVRTVRGEHVETGVIASFR